MKRKSEIMEINGEKLVITELTVDEMMPLMAMMEKDQNKAQKEIVGLSVTLNGASVGSDYIGKMGISSFLPIMKKVMAVNGMEVEEAKGNG